MKNLYRSEQIKAIDNLVANHLKISSFELMQKAGHALFSYIQNKHNILIIVGAGNNAGDGFIMALLAMQQGIKVTVLHLIAIEKLPTDALKAAQQYIENGGHLTQQRPNNNYDCIVDAIFGTGLSRDIEGVFADTINWVNSQHTQVIAVDIPSGLDTNTGNIRGCAIKAHITVSIICYKPGQVTHHGKDYCGQLFLETLDAANEPFQQNPSSLKLLDKSVLKHSLFQRLENTHKGTFGKALIVGGHDGMLGALILAGNAALHCGCGIVEVVSNNEQAVMISIQCPELITASNIKASRLLSSADVIAIGSGLGLNQQSREVLNYCLELNKTMVIDADAITLLADNKKHINKLILTPHPKEAASLLKTDIETIQSDRIAAAINISQMYQATTILKGSGTIIATAQGRAYICPFGYSGMATAGMGDVLTGMVASLLAQGFDCIDAANTAVTWHALAAESCHKGQALIATDVINQLANEII
jgi:NAD(P)H-hydrate epimerase